MIGFIGVTLLGCTNRQLGDPQWREEAVSWGEPVNGLRVGLARREYPAGKAPGVGEVYLGLRLKNVSGNEMKVLWPLKPEFGEPKWPLAGDESVVLEIRYQGAAGEKELKFKPPNRPMAYTIGPGEERVIAVRLAARDFGVERFSEGTISAAYENRQREISYGAEERVAGLWVERALSGAVAIEGAR